MAPMKYEEQMKDTMEQRTIQPSANSWQKLSERLDAEVPKRSHKRFWYLGIAASIVGVLLITKLVEKDTTSKIEPVIVETKTKVDTPKKDANETIKKEIEILANTTKKDVESNAKIEAVVKEKQPKQQQAKKEQLKLVSNKKAPEIIANNTTQQIKEKTPPPLSLEEQKAHEVVAQIQTLQKTKAVTNAEIDALLNAAQRDIAFKKLYSESTKTVDANSLLLSVEDEIQAQSLRTRVFEMLKAGYNEVKTVVAERNN